MHDRFREPAIEAEGATTAKKKETGAEIAIKAAIIVTILRVIAETEAMYSSLYQVLRQHPKATLKLLYRF
jgi:hypothetical protein